MTRSWKDRIRRFFHGTTWDERLTELRVKGKLRDESFHARRVFRVEEFEDEGPHIFIELADATVLHLNGQYLYDFGPPAPGFEVDPEFIFPSTSFVLTRHADEGTVLALRPTGEYLPPEATFPGFEPEVVAPDDGQVIIHTPYEQLLASRGRAASLAT